MPTTPTTPPDSAIAHGIGPAPSLVQEWRRLAQFLRFPVLPDDQGAKSPLTMIGRIFALDLIVMVALVAMAGIAVGLGVDLPETALAGFEFTPLLVFMVIVGAPVFEELAFRGWLSGKPGPLAATLIVATGLIATTQTDLLRSEAEVNLKALTAAVVTIGAAITALVVLRGRPAPRWFERGFPLFYWLSAIAFALIHVANFGDAPLVMVLPLVLPQFVIGLLLGYLRVQIGLWAAIVLHMAHNASMLTLASLTM